MMRAASTFGCLLAALVALAGGQVRAETWVRTAVSADDVFESDIAGVSRKGDVADSWMRRTPVRPLRDEKTGKLYVVELQQRYDDCANHRFAFGEFIRRDRQGAVVTSGDAVGGWRPIAPGSIADGVWRTVCAVSKPPAEKPFLDDIAAGQWDKVGLSADKTYTLSIKTDELFTIRKGVVIAVTRSDYLPGSVIEGFPVASVVSAAAVDCVRRESAALGADLYISPTARVKSVRTPGDKVAFESVPPGSFLFKRLDEVCAGADKVGATSEHAEAGSLASGTAWGVNKGYLVTASHVITDAKRIAVYDEGVLVGSATVVANDPANDLAVLKFKPKGATRLKILAIATKAPVLGRRVITIGYPEPDNLGQHIKVTSGEISSLAGYQDDLRFLQVSIPFQPGNSGGPVIAPDGAVVGIAQSKLMRFDDNDSEPAPEMVNYAVKASYLRPMLEDLPDLGNYVVVHPSPGADDLVAQARQAVFMLIVAR